MVASLTNEQDFIIHVALSIRDLFRVRYNIVVFFLHCLFLFQVSVDIALWLIFHIKMQKKLEKYVKSNINFNYKIYKQHLKHIHRKI